MSETEALFGVLREAADAGAAAAIEDAVLRGAESALARINALEFAKQHSLNEERAIGAFLHASRLGIFEMFWNVLCPGCGGVLGANSTLKDVHAGEYTCALCAAG